MISFVSIRPRLYNLLSLLGGIKLTKKFIYKGIDLTLDIYESIRQVVELIADREKITFDEAYLKFSRSHTFWCLQTPATLMWGEGVGFIFDEYYRELAGEQ